MRTRHHVVGPDERAAQDVDGAVVGSPPVGPPARALLVGSSGGHLAQLAALRPWWQGRTRHWVTFATPDAVSLLKSEKVTWAYHPTTRNLVNLVRNAGLSLRVLLTFRPDIVVSTGAGVAFPFFVFARMLRIKTVYIEVYDRLDTATLTGRLCHPLSSLFLLQSEEQRAMYPSGTVIGPLL